MPSPNIATQTLTIGLLHIYQKSSKMFTQVNLLVCIAWSGNWEIPPPHKVGPPLKDGKRMGV